MIRKNKIIIIAEAGVNHNGNIYSALKLVDIAAKSKADYIKFQIYNADEIATSSLLPSMIVSSIVALIN